MANLNDYSPERLADRAQIQDVLYQSCRAIDRLDLNAIRRAFHPGAVDKHGMYNGDVEGFIKWLDDRHKPIIFSAHSISNMLIEFAGPDIAIVETYVQGLQRYAADASASLKQLSGSAQGKGGAEIDMTVFCRYVDRFERRGGEWRIQERAVVFDSLRMSEVPADAPKMSNEWILGERRDRVDYVYEVRAAVGLID